MEARRALIAARRAATRHWIASAREESKLKIVVVAAGALGLVVGTYLLARAAFGWLADFGGAIVGAEMIATLLTAKLLALFSATLLALLATSSVAVAYGSLLRSRELPLLIASPLPTRELVRARTRETIVLASWASAFLSAPILLAWGQSIGAPVLLYATAAVLFVPFAVLAGSLGTLVLLTLARIFASRPVGPLVVVAIAAVAGLFRSARQVVRSLDTDGGVDLSTLLALVGRAESPWLPSSWFTEAVLAAARGELGAIVLPALLLGSWAALAFTAVLAVGERWHPKIWADLVDRDAKSGSRGRPFLSSRLIERFFASFTSPAVAQLAAKDLRTFWRDPGQWTQFAVFFGLLAVYLATMRTTLEGYDIAFWRALATTLNGAAALLVLATLTTRFVFPSIGVEGKRFWILGLAPLPRRVLVFEKLLLAALLATPFPLGLALLSGLRLGLPARDLAVSVVIVLLSVLALGGIAVGLGCLLPGFDEDDPSRVVSGFGGTLAFVASLGWVLVATVVQAVVLRWDIVDAFLGTGWSPAVATAVLLGVLTVLAIVAAGIPLRLGVRRLERLEL